MFIDPSALINIADTASDVANSKLFTTLVQVAAYITPYFLIPAAFRAGMGVFGALTGMLNDRSRGFFDGQRKRRQAAMAQKKEHTGRRIIAKRADLNSALMNSASQGNWAKRTALRGVAKGVGGYNIAAQHSARQAAVAKELNDQIATGDDTEIRALTALKGSDGKYRTLAGKEVGEAYVKQARSRWGNDVFAQQAALSYEMRKASSEGEIQNVAKNYGAVAKKWGMSENQATGAWIGSAFENQNAHLEYKNMRLDKSTGQMRMDGSGYKSFVNEVYEKRGSYNMAQMGSNTFAELEEAYTQATNSGDTETARRVQAVAETFMSRYGGGGGNVAHVTDDGVPIPSTGGGGGSGYQTNAPGAAHVAENVRKLAVTTGVYRQLDGSTDIHSAGGPYNGPRQN